MVKQEYCVQVPHCTDKCTGLDQNSSKVLQSNAFIRYMCYGWIQYIHNIDMVLGEIQDGVNKNKISLAEYKKELELSLKQNEYEIKKLLKRQLKRDMRKGRERK